MIIQELKYKKRFDNLYFVIFIDKESNKKF